MHTAHINELLYMNLPVKEKRRKSAGQQMLRRDLRMLLSGFGSERTMLLFVYVTLNKKQT